MSIYGLLILARAATNHDGLLVHHMVLVQTDGVLWDVYVQGSIIDIALLGLHSFCLLFFDNFTLNADFLGCLRPHFSTLLIIRIFALNPKALLIFPDYILSTLNRLFFFPLSQLRYLEFPGPWLQPDHSLFYLVASALKGAQFNKLAVVATAHFARRFERGFA